MNPMLNNQLLHLDRALLGLLDERARLVADFSRDSARPAIDDLLRRRAGPIDATDVRAFFTAVDAATAPTEVGP